MNLLNLLFPMWACSFSLFSFVILARPESTISFIPASVLRPEQDPISQFSSQMEAASPAGVAVVRVVHHQDLNKRILIALIVASTLLGGLLLFLLCFWICRLKILKNSNGKSNQNQEPTKALSLSPIVDRFNSLWMAGKKGSVAVIEYRLLEAATNGFLESNVLGEGGRGRVYKASFDEKYLAAVKKLDDVGVDAEREFENEVDWLVKIRHPNIVSLLGYCIHGETRLLVYEMMQNGSLESQLHGPSQGSDLSWHLRMKIAIDVARALEYLHENCNPPVVHRDIKSSNILLDSNFNAKLSDFGLAVTTGSQNKNVKLSGTLGYVAPEYLLEGKLTDKSDVYAFGVVLLELLIGKKPLEKMSPTRCQSLVSWVMPQLTDRLKLPNIVDPVIKDTMDLKHLYQVAAVAVLCIQPEPSYRPLITDVLHSLIPLVPVELGGSLRVT
ncbi:putative receptor-like protein kinase [Hibiscus syriacus]|uniref:Receptor-like protein kinase n=1 Tax=Hibiscus syriacus TaxID=106335 RepID=A0A6A3A608_HIBSY|nr:probable receptor-like protein kinase At1g80640 isoform X1 [Hibiscus syriacus]KAE8699296.1 putative receptor-like protein kinase [Hibiscus syriacus]